MVLSYPMIACENFFITGTDTGVGKTWATLALMGALKQEGLRVAGMKPVASGCENTAAGLHNADALQIQAQCSDHHPYEIINPCAYEPPIAPHVAAEAAGRPIDLAAIASAYRLLQQQSDVVVVEGVGGWSVPLGKDLLLKDMVLALGLPVLLVVGLRLGCINHTLLTAESARNNGFQIKGWLANPVEQDYVAVDKTIETLEQRLPAPRLATFPWLPEFDLGQLIEAVCLKPLLAMNKP